MSVTFSIQGIHEEDGYELPCPSCGQSMRDCMDPERRDYDCTACMGYGGPAEMPQPQFELNVANTNALALLAFLGLPAECCGDADPQDILTALALRYDSHAELATDTVVDGNVTHVGRSPFQCARYLEQLTKIATKAAKYDRRVVWG